MKKIIMLVAAIAIVLPCKSQDVPDYSLKRNELNLGYINAFELNAIGDLGIGYKRLGDKGAFRTGIGMDFSKYEREYDSFKSLDSGYELSPRVGYEFHQWYKRLRLQYGCDLTASYGKWKDEYVYDDPVNNRFLDYESVSLGIRPVLGLTVFLSKSVSIATETFMDISYFRSTEERTDNSGTDNYETKGMNVGLGPLGIVSVNFHF